MRTYDRETRGSVAVLAARLTEAAAVLGRGDARSAPAYVRDVVARGPEVASAAAAVALSRALELLWQRGWLPGDAIAAVPRPLTRLLADAIAHECARYPASRLHPRWRAELAEIGPARPLRFTALAPALTKVVELIAELMALPQLPHLAPAPGSPVADEPRAPGVDRRVLARVRGLLAKAESTPYPEEAEALSAKAQELMARYAFEQAVLEADDRRPQDASARRLWLTAPYQGPKAQLVDAVASANRCRAVFYSKLGCVGIVGHDTDLEIVEVLASSLHVQATRAMTRAPSRTRAYRHSFLVAYAHRIRQRLDTAGHDATCGDTRLVPVLAARKHAVDIKFDAMFPGIRVRRSSVSDAAGWGAGLAAADQADLHPHRRVAS
ncbi:DUF2786 domain-containing protein [Actinokineospora iranica]|uniref:Uncharacterized protein n=1 Tax=Actinokineospora iranica TaxID=1271860 RepID=A0A1G6NY22_9PSEU|nr:DUF2786 domain-containing protein [Actinokineospora iranica]SDC72842.1 Protein of unknown function [Actinokineospora iranica]